MYILQETYRVFPSLTKLRRIVFQWVSSMGALFETCRARPNTVEQEDDELLKMSYTLPYFGYINCISNKFVYII